MKILIGGVPFGCNNVGDEAILECVINILRGIKPDAEITVSTHDPVETQKKLGVRTCELMGFDFPYDRASMERELREHDVFLWCGATGLSDYPEIPLQLLRIAKSAHRKVILWGVGMNRHLNPAKYKVLPGKRRTLLLGIQFLTLGLVDAIALREMRCERKVRAQIAQDLTSADLIVVRDPESRTELLNCGVDHEIEVGADSALTLAPAAWDSIPLTEAANSFLTSRGRKIGVCISTASPHFKDLPGLVRWLDLLVEEQQAKLLFLPMDPITDLELMTDLRSKMRLREETFVLHGRYEPAEILGLLPRLDLIVTSRLHLLILSSIANVPFVGISCGSKVDNFLHQHGLHAPTSVDECDFASLNRETQRLLSDSEFRATGMPATRELLLKRLQRSILRLKEVLG